MSRKVAKQSCMNPLFLSWLEGWRDEAKEKGLNAQWTYEKAITSLKKYPLPLRSGKEAKILENIGDGIAKKLDKALEEFIKNGGDVSMMHALQQSTNTITTSAPPQNLRKKKSVAEDETGYNINSDGSELEMKKRKKEYLPKQKSGPFALLLTLYRESQKEDYKGFLTKDELQTKAEPLIEKSFSKPEPGTHYTPWSCMSTLIAKGFITKSSNPAKYCITDEGIRLGCKLDEIEVQNPSFKPPEIRTTGLNQQQPQHKSLLASSTQQQQQRLSQPTTHVHFKALSAPSHASNSVCRPETMWRSTVPPVDDVPLSGKLRFWYVDDKGRLSNLKDDAVVNVEDGIVWFLIKCDEESLKSSRVSYKIDSCRLREGRFVFAFLADQAAENISAPPVESQDVTYSTLNSHSSKDNQTASSLSMKSQAKAIDTATMRSPDAVFESISPSQTASIQRRIFLADGNEDTSLFNMHPGSFDVILCVDQMEVVGGANTNSKRMMLDRLKRMDVNMDIRKLQLGDFLWIAREKYQVTGKKREVVLDFIVERKRMDDLAGSIVDGRFKEQKFRLKSCGLKHVIYLVENYGSIEHMVLPEATLKQAIVNSQIVDGLFIRQTGSIHESAAYLCRLTQHLQHFYQGKTLKAYPVDQIKKMKEDRAFNEIIQNDVQFLMRFEDFYETTNKSKLLSVKEMFAKHLMQLKGVSAEKASAIVEQYPTPKWLVSAYEQCASQNEKEVLLSEITFGNMKRKIGPMLSKQISQLYSSKVPLT